MHLALSFDEMAGDIARDSFGQHDADVNGPTWTENGRYGSALVFDGVNDLLTVHDSDDLDLADGFTLEAWVSPTAASHWQPVLTKETTGFMSYQLYANGSGGPPQAYVANASWSYGGVSGSAALPLNSWSHLAATSDGDVLRLYVNGSQVSTATSRRAQSSDGDLQIGGNTIWSEYFSGVIDEVQIYDRPLPSSEVQDDMLEPIGEAPRPRPIAAYGFEETSGGTARDSVGDSDGTLLGASRTSAGRYGAALDFDGVNDVVEIRDEFPYPLHLTNDFTLEAWVKPSTSRAWMPVLTKESTSFMAYQLYAQGNAGKPAGYVADADWSYTGVNGATALPQNGWSYLTLTSDGRRLRLYVNGSQVGSTVSRRAQMSWGDLLLGGNHVFDEYFAGQLDEVRLYDRRLSAAEISEDQSSPVEEGSVPTTMTSGLSFDEGSGSALFDTRSTTGGQVHGAVFTSGKLGGALEFDGVDDFASIADKPALDLQNSFAIESWVRPNKTSAWGTILSRGAASNPAFQLAASPNSGRIRATLGGAGSSSRVLNSSEDLPASAWTHVAFVQDSTRVRLFVNGSLVDSKTALPPRESQAPLYLGRSDSGQEFDGRLDELRMFAGSRTRAQVAADSEKPLTSLEAYWNFDRDSEPVTSGSGWISAASPLVDPDSDIHTPSDYDIAIIAEDGTADRPLGANLCSSQWSGSWPGLAHGCVRNVATNFQMAKAEKDLQFHAELIRVSDNAVVARSEQLTAALSSPWFGVKLTASQVGSSSRAALSGMMADDSIRFMQEPVSMTLVEAASGTNSACSWSSGNFQIYVACGEHGPGTYQLRVQVDGLDVGRSSWVEIGPDGSVADLVVDGLDLRTLASRFASTSQMCNAFLHWGTHNSGSSLSDQYQACEAGMQLGLSREAILRGLVGLAAGSATVWYLDDYATIYEDRETGLISPDPESETPRRLPVPLPIWPGNTIDLSDTLMRQNPVLTRIEADTVARQCTNESIVVDCTDLPIFVTGNEPGVAAATKHDREAIRDGQPSVLTRHPMDKGDRSLKKGWYRLAANEPNACTGKTGAATGNDCDEYPFFDTSQSGPGASLKPVPLSQNRRQGNYLQGFFNACKVKRGDPFITVPVPESSPLPTFSICNYVR